MTRNIILLGFPSIAIDGQPSELTRNYKGTALLTYLLVRRRPETREHIADLLWDSNDTSASLRNLRVLLTRIRPRLPSLIITRSTVQYDPGPDEAIDYLSLTGKLSAKDTDILLEDLRLYRGELLEGIYLEDAPRFMEWLILERERLRRTVIDAHRELCQSLADQHHWLEGGEAAAHWLSIDPLDEDAVRWQMQFMGANGQASAALKAYEAYKVSLRDHLGLEPEEITQTLASELLASVGSFEAITFPAPATLAGLDPDELPDPGPLPVNTILPFQRNDDFVGREDILMKIASALGTAPQDGHVPAAALTGIGGMGKTQTAVEFCCRYGRFFPGGVFWLNFEKAANAAGEMVMIGSERGLGLYLETDGLSLNDQLGRVQRALQEPIPRLLIFDNCEDEALCARWRPVTGGCRILLTSRQNVEDWRAGIQALPLNVLDESESIDLLQKLVPHITAEDASAIAHEVANLPLALHLAGSFLNRYKEIDPARYIKQLQEKGLLQHPSLQGRGAGHSPTGHELSVVRTYLINWEKLNPANPVDAIARQLLVCAASLAPAEPIPAGWLKEIVRGEAGDDLNMILQVEDGLSKLINLGFLSKLPNQMAALHPLLASFTQETCGEDEFRGVQRLVTSSLTRTFSEHFQKHGYFSNLPISANHLRYVSHEALAQNIPMAANLATLLGGYQLNIGETLEAKRSLERACAAAKETGDVLVQAQAFKVVSNIQEILGHYEESLESIEKAVSLYKEADSSDPDGWVEALWHKASVLHRLEQAEAALRVAEEGYALSQAVHLQLAEARFLSLMGVVNYYYMARYNLAQQQLEKSEVIYRKLGKGENTALGNMGENARLQGNFPLAARYYEEALAAVSYTKNQNWINLLTSNLCGARIGMGEFEEAAADLEKLIATVKHDWLGMSEAHRFLAEAYLGLGNTEQALTMAQRALAFANKSEIFDASRAWRVLGMISSRLGVPIRCTTLNDELCDAPTCFERSLAFFNEGESQRDRAITLWHWAQYELTNGNKKEGKEMQQEAEDIFHRLNLPLMIKHLKSR